MEMKLASACTRTPALGVTVEIVIVIGQAVTAMTYMVDVALKQDMKRRLYSLHSAQWLKFRLCCV